VSAEVTCTLLESEGYDCTGCECPTDVSSQCTDLLVVMNDTGGDGWQGATLQV
jgi:hypothetical protein